MKLEFSWQISEKYSNIKFHESLSSGSWVVPYGRMNRQPDMMKLTVAFPNFANAPKNDNEPLASWTEAWYAGHEQYPARNILRLF
jgi:hypothetical protein